MNSPNEKFLGTTCKQCGTGSYIENENASEWWAKCDDCGHLFFCYEPMPHQLRFHEDSAKYKLYGGGYGSAKTSTCGAEFVSLAIGTPNGRGLVGAQTYPQLEQTCKKQIIEMMPSELIASYNQQKNEMVLTNGYEILFRSFDDEQKLRSLNLCHVYIEEANGVAYEVYTQLQTRLRHHATNNHKIIMATNPDGNWIKTEILLKAGRIVGSDVKYPRKKSEIDPNISVHIAKTALNTFLPRNYIADLRANKPDWWIRRYLDGSFENAEGRVYPNFESAIEDKLTYKDVVHKIKTEGWKVLGMSDFGIRDNTVLLLAAIDPREGMVYVYDEYVRNQVAVPSHAREMKNRMQHIPLGSLQNLVGDPSGAKRNISDMKSLFSHYAEYGIHFQKGDNRIDAGIQKVYSYLEMGKLKILSHLENTIEEHVNYMYKPVEIGEKADEKPIDKNNHTCDSLRYGIQTLPDDPSQLITETYGAQNFIRQGEEQNHLPPQLQDDEDNYSNMQNDWYTYY
ncbi:MAG: phage terminase large subunit [Psychrobacillus sp.]